MWATRQGDLKLARTHADSAVQLFDLAADPAERKDLSADRPQTVAELKRSWEQWNSEQQPGQPKHHGKDKSLKKENKK